MAATTNTPPRPVLRNTVRRNRSSLSKPPLSPMPRPERPISIGRGHINWSPPASPKGRSLAFSEDSFWMVDVEEWSIKNPPQSPSSMSSSRHHHYLMIPQEVGRGATSYRKHSNFTPTLRPRTNSDAGDTDLFGLAFLEQEEQSRTIQN